MTSPAGPAPEREVPGIEEPPSSATRNALRGRRRRGAGLGSSVRLFFRVMRANPLTFVGFVLVVLIVGTAALVEVVPFVTGALLGHAIYLYPYTPTAPNAYGTLLPPSPSHWMGTDYVGRDLFSLVLAATPLDLFIGITVAAFGLVLGGALGLVAGYWDTPGTLGGYLSVGIMRVTDIFLSFPTLVLALAISASLGRGTYPSMFAVMVTWWPFYVRLARGEVLVIKHQPYITAARAAGVRDGQIVVRHVLRNLLEPLLVYFTLDIGTVIVTYSTISYVGIGVPIGVPEWGNLIEQYQDFLLAQPWLIGFVALAIFVTVLAFSLLGDGLRDLLDPRSRRALATTAATATTQTSTLAEVPLAGGERP
jgi:peptide/nickel transport system permease protein